MPEGSYFWRNTTYCHDAIFFPFSMTGLHACYRRQTQNMWWTIAAFSESSTNQACRFVSCTNTSSEASLHPQGFRVHANHQIIRWALFSCKHLCQYCSLHRAGCYLLLEICCWRTIFELARGVTHGQLHMQAKDFSISAYNKWNHLKANVEKPGLSVKFKWSMISYLEILVKNVKPWHIWLWVRSW